MIKKKFLFVLLLVLVDQFSKFLVLRLGIFPVSLNQGISFGLLAYRYWLIVDFVVISLLVIILSRRSSIPPLLIFSGGFSNFLDRIFWGGVVDFISLPFFPWKFNLADLGITVGVILLILRLQGLSLQKCKDSP